MCDHLRSTAWWWQRQLWHTEKCRHTNYERIIATPHINILNHLIILHTFAHCTTCPSSSGTQHCWVFINVTSNTWSIITLQPVHRLSSIVRCQRWHRRHTTEGTLPHFEYFNTMPGTCYIPDQIRVCVCVFVRSYGWLIFGWQLVGSRNGNMKL